MTSELLPCPFCGSEAWVVPIGPLAARVECQDCDAMVVGHTRDRAITAWNTRAEASQAEVERLTRERDEWKGRAADREHEAEQRARKQWAAEARATRAEEEIARRDAVAKASWGDQKDQHTDAILAAHPTYTKDFDTYDAALAMVSTRHGKYELVNLVNWLLARATRAEGLLAEAYRALDGHNSLLRSAFQAAQRDATHDVRGTTNYRLLADRAHEVLTGHHATTNAARAFLDKLKEQG